MDYTFIIKEFNIQIADAEKSIYDLQYVVDTLLFTFGESALTSRLSKALETLKASVSSMKNLVYQDIQTQLIHNQSMVKGLVRITNPS